MYLEKIKFNEENISFNYRKYFFWNSEKTYNIEDVDCKFITKVEARGIKSETFIFFNNEEQIVSINSSFGWSKLKCNEIQKRLEDAKKNPNNTSNK